MLELKQQRKILRALYSAIFSRNEVRVRKNLVVNIMSSPPPLGDFADANIFGGKQTRA